MSADENLKNLVYAIDCLQRDVIRTRTKVIEVSNATDWLGTKYEREWLFKAEAAMQEAIVQLANAGNAVDNVRASWAKKEAKK